MKNKKREKPNFRVPVNNSWLGIECLVKAFNRGEDEKNDVSEINEKFAGDKEEPILDDE